MSENLFENNLSKIVSLWKSNDNCDDTFSLQNILILSLSVINLILLMFFTCICYCKKKKSNIRSEHSWDPKMRPNRSSIRRNPAFFDESPEIRQRNSVFFKMEEILISQPAIAPKRNSRVVKMEYIRQQSKDEEYELYAQPCDSINGKTFENIVINKLYDEIQCVRADDNKILYAEIRHENPPNKSVKEEKKKSEENIIYAELDLLQTVNKK